MKNKTKEEIRENIKEEIRENIKLALRRIEDTEKRCGDIFPTWQGVEEKVRQARESLEEALKLVEEGTD